MVSPRGKKDYFRRGDYNALCQVCGFKFKASELKLRWDGIRTCPKDFELRHPQDLIRGKPDNPSVPWASPNNIEYLTPTPVDGSKL